MAYKLLKGVWWGIDGEEGKGGWRGSGVRILSKTITAMEFES